MLRGNWLKHPKTRLVGGLVAGIAFCSLWIGYGLLETSNYERQARAKSEEYARRTGDKVAETCVGIPRLERIRCLNEAQDAQSEYEYNQADLVAQRQSALWAYIMAAAAVLGMALSAVGVWLVWTTFRETRRTAEIAQNNLNAFQHAERGFVHILDAHLADVEALAGMVEGGKLRRFYFQIENPGRSGVKITRTGRPIVRTPSGTGTGTIRSFESLEA